ncbi:hypothetical protein CRYUN_Cryun27aG0078500 [Craigia yunnanensis]
MGSSNTALNDGDDESATESDNTATKTDSDSDSETETDEEIRNRYDTGPFREGEKVLAYHNLRIYVAKVLRFEKQSNGWHYYVHYLVYENRQKQEALKKEVEEEKKAEFHTTKRGTARVFHFKLRNTKDGRGKRRKKDSSSKEKSVVPSEKPVNIQIPLTLKKQLIDDCEFITHLGKLVKLPRTPNVEDILKLYLDYRCKKDGTVTDSVREIFKGIRAYFNKALPVMLLYKGERQQYEYTITEDIRPSTVYGAEHLLRLFVKLPELLVRADIEEEALLELQQKLVDFLNIWAENPCLWEAHSLKGHKRTIGAKPQQTNLPYSQLHRCLVANRDHPVNGRRSKLSLLGTGNLILTDAAQFNVWATDTASLLSVQLQLDDYGNLILSNSEGTILWKSFDSPTHTLLPLQPLTRYTPLVSRRKKGNYSSGFYKFFFDDDNVLRLLFDGPEISSVYWPGPWLPCRIHGFCGENSLCSYAPSGRKCSCPKGYKVKSQTDWSYGCESEFDISLDSSDLTFIHLRNAGFYGYDFGVFYNKTLKECETACLQRVNCKGFQYKFNGSGFYDCFPKALLRNGHQTSSFNGDVYVKLPKSYFSYNKNELFQEISLDCRKNDTIKLERSYSRSQENGIVKFMLWFACALGGVEIISIFLVWLFLNRARQEKNVAQEGYLLTATGFKRFTFDELKEATQNFSEEIGRGGGGIVYKGMLPDGRVLAVKRLNEANQGEAEFLAEVNTIGKLNHMNLIEMWGFCAEKKHRLLVYEYMEHGSVAEKLSSNELDWQKR